MAKRNPPMEVSASRGMTVKTLQRLLATANPDALVIIEGGAWRRCRKATLDALPMACNNRPCVRIE